MRDVHFHSFVELSVFFESPHKIIGFRPYALVIPQHSRTRTFDAIRATFCENTTTDYDEYSPDRVLLLLSHLSRVKNCQKRNVL